MIKQYAKALLGAYAKKMRDVIHEVQANETDEIVVHKLLVPFFANAASQTPQIFDEPALPDKPIF